MHWACYELCWHETARRREPAALPAQGAPTPAARHPASERKAPARAAGRAGLGGLAALGAIASETAAKGRAMKAETKDDRGNWIAFEIDAGKVYASASAGKRVELTRQQLEFLGRVIEHMIEDLPADYPDEPVGIRDE